MIGHEVRDHSNSENALDRHGFHSDNKVDAVYVFSLQEGVVRHKQAGESVLITISPPERKIR